MESSSSSLSFSILRVPFFLEPGYPENIVSIGTNRERLIQKWGGPKGWEAQKKRHDLKGRGQKAGIPHFNLDRLTGNTMASHRLIQHVGKLYGLSVSEKLYDRLNIYYFVDGHSLNDRPRLAKVTAEVIQKQLLHSDQIPLSEKEILNFLNSDEGRPEIEKALQMLNYLGIHSIPKFIIEGTTLVDGAADPSVFIDVFSQIEKRGYVENDGKPVFGDILKIPQNVLEGTNAQ